VIREEERFRLGQNSWVIGKAVKATRASRRIRRNLIDSLNRRHVGHRRPYLSAGIHGAGGQRMHPGCRPAEFPAIDIGPIIVHF